MLLKDTLICDKAFFFKEMINTKLNSGYIWIGGQRGKEFTRQVECYR